jgi:tRNA isopentenyl-2-thiomethyl-A-37 hydroxylase MiaE
MINSIQTYLRVDCKRNLTLIDKSRCVFRNLNSALNFVLKDRAQQGLGMEVCQAKLISEEQEHYSWLHGFLGSSNA